MPATPPRWAFSQQWALEVFAGKANLTAELQAVGFNILPPIDIELSKEVAESFDVLRQGNLMKLLAWLPVLSYLHLGTPCSSFSQALNSPNGPPRVRSRNASLRSA